MNIIRNYRIPHTLQFTISPKAFKPKRAPTSSNKKLTKLLYCVAKKEESGWKAYINTRGIEGFGDITVLDFTEKSFELKGRRDVFLHHKDETNHWVRIIRTQQEADLNPGSVDVFCSLCNNDCFVGYIVKVNGIMQFDMSYYKGIAKDYDFQLTRNNKKNNEEE